MSRFVNPAPQFWLNDGAIATSGKMVFFENGDYSTKKDTYANSALTTENTNPVTLDGQGRMPPCFGEGLYSVKFYAYDNAAVDKLGVLQWTRDDVSLSNGGAEFSDWSAVQTYSIGDAAKDSGLYYILYGSATSKGERPSTTPAKWEQVTFLTVWNSNKASSGGYEINETVVKDGLLYQSLVAANATTPPSASWGNLTFNDSVPGDFSVGGNLSTATITGPSSGTLKVASTEAQVGADAGDYVRLRNDGFLSRNGGSYSRVATTSTVTGLSFVSLTDAGATRFPRINSDGSVTQRDAAGILSDLSITNQPEIDVTLTADWGVSVSGMKAKVVHGILYLYGSVVPTSGSPSSLIFTLPVSYRPSAFRFGYALYFTTPLDMAFLEIGTTGAVNITANAFSSSVAFRISVAVPL